MSFRLLDVHDGLATGMRVEGDGKITVRTWQDVEPFVEMNKVRQTDGSNGYGKTRELRHTMSIPHNVFLMWLQADGILPMVAMRWSKYEKVAYLKKKVNDPDYQYLRTVPGRV